MKTERERRKAETRSNLKEWNCRRTTRREPWATGRLKVHERGERGREARRREEIRSRAEWRIAATATAVPEPERVSVQSPYST
jgi:hypothetical protein